MLNNKTNREKIQIVYICYILGLLVFIPSIFGVILAYAVRNEVGDDDWLQSHVEWLILTFWFGLAGLLMAMLASMGLLGSVLYIFCGVWTVYRIVRGWIKFAVNQPVLPTRYFLI
jgi:uncharacterized membrane protein